MSGDKKDLTRIEELGQYVHELDQDNDPPEEDLFDPPGLPDTPSENSSASDEVEEPFNISFDPEDELDPFQETSFSEKTQSFSSDDSEEFKLSSEADFSSPDSTDLFSGAEDLTSGPEEEFKPENDFPSSFEEATSNFNEREEDPEPEIYQARPTQVIEEVAYKTPENFEDIKKFAESSIFSGMGVEGNPSFSVLIKNIRFVEDVQDILILLKELGLLSDPEEQTRERLMRGNLLVPRISEYAAISLAHKLRRFDIDIQVGLSDEIHPPKHKEAADTGLVSKHSLYQNQTHHFHFDDPKLELSQIIVAATPSLEGHQVVKYIGVASEHKILEGHIIEDENSTEVPRYYHELAQKLRAHALKAHANAVVGLNYQLTPIPSDLGLSTHKYRLSCTGNLVWVNKL